MFLFFQKRPVQTSILLSFFTIMMCLRAPDIFLYGRFWAEEGNIFFYNAWVMSPLQALFNSYGGYLNLATNAVTLIARWCIPFEYAPYFTTCIGLLFQLLPLLLLLSAKDEWLASFQVRLFLTLLLIFVPESFETSLQSLHIQFQLSLASALILILKPNFSYQRWLKLFTLGLAGLSGLMNIILLPLYAIRFLMDKNKLRFEELLMLLISCSIQYFFFYEKITSRFHSIRISDFSNIFFIRELYIPFLGLNHYTIIYIDYLRNNMLNAYTSILPMIIVIFFGVSVLYIFYKQPKTQQASFLFFAALLLFIISIIGSIGNRSDFLIPLINQRYLFISQSLLCVTLVYITYHLSFSKQKIGKIIICWLILIGGVNYFTYPNFFIQAPNNYLPWQQQVKLWRQNSNYNFQIWPHWDHMTLPKQK